MPFSLGGSDRAITGFDRPLHCGNWTSEAPKPTLKTGEKSKNSLRSNVKAPLLRLEHALWAQGGSAGPLPGSPRRTGSNSARQQRGALRMFLI